MDCIIFGCLSYHAADVFYQGHAVMTGKQYVLAVRVLRACLNFPIKSYCQVSFEFVSGLFSRFYASDSPLSSL